jgi:uncharacterized protein (TIGR03032 family)
MTRDLTALWEQHTAAWRSAAQIASHWREADSTDPRLLRYRVHGSWWELLASLGITLLVTREYEHLLLAISANERGPQLSYMPMPHPSGLAVDTARGIVYVASTRNPNQIFEFAPVSGLLNRPEVRAYSLADERPLVPIRSRFLPGALYLHDLALIDGQLHANAVGQNCVIRVDPAGAYERVWWPRCIESSAGPEFSRNHLQLNSIAAGASIEESFFSASSEVVSKRRPGHRNFPVNRRGVIFSGATREVVARGLTRPHSARLFDGSVWLDNSGYGEVGVVAGEFVPVAKLPGWTRGLCVRGRIAFVGTSRVIPRFRQYAPGLDLNASSCGIHALDTQSGNVLGSLIWPYGNQIFAVDWVPSTYTTGFPLRVGARRASAKTNALFYAFHTEHDRDGPASPARAPREAN